MKQYKTAINLQEYTDRVFDFIKERLSRDEQCTCTGNKPTNWESLRRDLSKELVEMVKRDLKSQK